MGLFLFLPVTSVLYIMNGDGDDDDDDPDLEIKIQEHVCVRFYFYAIKLSKKTTTLSRRHFFLSTFFIIISTFMRALFALSRNFLPLSCRKSFILLTFVILKI